MKVIMVFTGLENTTKAVERLNVFAEPFLNEETESTALYLGKEEVDISFLEVHLKGIKKCCFLKGSAPFLPEAYLEILTAFCKTEKPDLLIFYESVENNPLAVRLSYRLDGDCVTNCTAAALNEGQLEIKKKVYNAYADALMIKKQWPLVLTASKAGTIAKWEEIKKKSARVAFNYEVGRYSYCLRHSIKTIKAKNPLEEKKFVFVGGKGLGTKENYERLRRIAEAWGGACGCTRAAALSGFGDVADIIGQSGLSIRADICVVVGVSGAGPFMAGVSNVKLLAAVNTDENAPIFTGADYGIVADAVEILAEWENLIEVGKGEIK